MITRFFKKKKKDAPTKARKAVTAEKPKPKAKPKMHQRTLTAEGWRRMMMRARKAKKS